MKKLILVFVIFGLLATQAIAQKTHVGVSFNLVNDFNWNRPSYDIDFFPSMSLYSKIPFNMGIEVEQQMGKLSPSLGVNLIHRTLNVREQLESIAGASNFIHQTLEIPVKLNYRLPLNSSSHLVVHAGAGLSRVLSSSEKTSTNGRSTFTSGDSTITQFRSFSIVNPDKFVGFGTIGAGIETQLGKMGTLRLNYQFVYYFSEWLKYTDNTNGFIRETGSYRPNYGMAGFTYYLPLFGKRDK